jgi:hemoglobin-like flavoprotein
MDSDLVVLKSSFRRLSPHADALAARFYSLLFARHPEVRPLFAGVALEDQQRKLTRALSLVVRHLEEPHFLRAYLQGLGAIHLAYGVTTESYRAVCDCLLDALAETAGQSWTEAEHGAWHRALEMISETMLAGAAALGPGEQRGLYPDKLGEAPAFHGAENPARVRPEREQDAERTGG